MRHLFIDLGHSIRFPGAKGVMAEIEWNRTIWAKLQPLIDQRKWLIREVPTDYGVLDLTANRQLINRIKWINRNCVDGDVLLSIHGNSALNPSVRGVTTCYMGGSEYARVQAIKLSNAYSKATGVPVWNGGAFDDRTARFGQIGMVRETRPFALLIEAGFVSNKLDMAVKPELAAQGIANYFNQL